MTTAQTQADYIEDMTVADYFQSKQETRDMLENAEAPESLFPSLDKLRQAIEKTENMEEKSGILNEDALRALLSDRDRLSQMLSETHLRETKVSDLVANMIMEQKVQQEMIRQEMESLRNELLSCKTLIEQLTQSKDPVSPVLDANIIRSKVYQIIGDVDSTRRDIASNISLVRNAIMEKKDAAINSCKEFADKTVKAVSGFFSRIKDMVTGMKNELFSSISSARSVVSDQVDSVKSDAIDKVSSVLDSSAKSLLHLRDIINGTTPEQMEAKWIARNNLGDQIKLMVEKRTPEKKILKYIKEFCSDNDLGESGIREGKDWMKTCSLKQGFSY